VLISDSIRLVVRKRAAACRAATRPIGERAGEERCCLAALVWSSVLMSDSSFLVMRERVERTTGTQAGKRTLGERKGECCLRMRAPIRGDITSTPSSSKVLGHTPKRCLDRAGDTSIPTTAPSSKVLGHTPKRCFGRAGDTLTPSSKVLCSWKRCAQE